jgi:hypothetical protein
MIIPLKLRTRSNSGLFPFLSTVVLTQAIFSIQIGAFVKDPKVGDPGACGLHKFQKEPDRRPPRAARRPSRVPEQTSWATCRFEVARVTGSCASTRVLVWRDG